MRLNVDLVEDLLTEGRSDVVLPNAPLEVASLNDASWQRGRLHATKRKGRGPTMGTRP